MQSISFYRFMTKSEIDCIKCLCTPTLKADRIRLIHTTKHNTTQHNTTLNTNQTKQSAEEVKQMKESRAKQSKSKEIKCTKTKRNMFDLIV